MAIEIYGKNSLSLLTLRFPALLLQEEPWYQSPVSSSRNIGCAYASYMCVYVYMWVSIFALLMIYNRACSLNSCTCKLGFVHDILTSSNSVQFSCSVVSNSLWPHGQQYARLACPSPAPGACSGSCPSSFCKQFFDNKTHCLKVCHGLLWWSSG